LRGGYGGQSGRTATLRDVIRRRHYQHRTFFEQAAAGGCGSAVRAISFVVIAGVSSTTRERRLPQHSLALGKRRRGGTGVIVLVYDDGGLMGALSTKQLSKSLTMMAVAQRPEHNVVVVSNVFFSKVCGGSDIVVA
jgi:hypothetical protein